MRSWSISTSSGSTAPGSITIDSREPVPLTTALTAPPPTDASTVSAPSASWAAAMSACIFWTCFNIWFISFLLGTAVLLWAKSLAHDLALHRGPEGLDHEVEGRIYPGVV